MIYLKSFELPSQATESGAFGSTSPTYFTTLYPFQVFPSKGLKSIHFSDITIFSGSNGSGKSTLLNVIGEKLGLERVSPFNKTELYDQYIRLTDCEMDVFDRVKLHELMGISKIITSDDVFEHILKVREKNANIDFKRSVIRDRRTEYLYDRDSRPREINFEDEDSVARFKEYAELTNHNTSFSSYVRRNMVANERTYSNGENAFRYFTDAIKPGGLYLLDEPENSLSAQYQLDLADFLLGMARFYDCQFIISSHSPFLLSIPYALIFDMDKVPVVKCSWTELPNVRIYHDFFDQHKDEFEGQ